MLYLQGEGEGCLQSPDLPLITNRASQTCYLCVIITLTIMTVKVKRPEGWQSMAGQIIGSFQIDGKEVCKTMELPWKQNQRSISCIPAGSYDVIKQPPKADRPYPYFRFVSVPGRSGILIHKITYVSGLKGCIGVGKATQDLNQDGVPDIIRSGEALTELLSILPDKFKITVE